MVVWRTDTELRRLPNDDATQAAEQRGHRELFLTPLIHVLEFSFYKLVESSSLMHLPTVCISSAVKLTNAGLHMDMP